jgi:hypothetical protein
VACSDAHPYEEESDRREVIGRKMGREIQMGFSFPFFFFSIFLLLFLQHTMEKNQRGVLRRFANRFSKQVFKDFGSCTFVSSQIYKDLQIW